jgi:hypothetical protein
MTVLFITLFVWTGIHVLNMTGMVSAEFAILSQDIIFFLILFSLFGLVIHRLDNENRNSVMQNNQLHALQREIKEIQRQLKKLSGGV